MIHTHSCFRTLVTCLLALGAIAVLSGNPTAASGPPWNAPSVPPWERQNYQGYKEPPHVVQQAIPRSEQPHAAAERYTVVITPLKDAHKLEDANTVHLMAHVPDNAHVWIEGSPTTQRGPIRDFVSPPLTPGKNYLYTIRVDWMEGSKAVSQTKKVLVRAGELHCLSVVPAGSPTDLETRIGAGLARLPREDHELVVAQKFCAIQPDVRLGEMGLPVKIMIKGQPVFLCCEACQGKAEENPDKTLAKVKELKAKNKPPTTK